MKYEHLAQVRNGMVGVDVHERHALKWGEGVLVGARAQAVRSGRAAASPPAGRAGVVDGQEPVQAAEPLGNVLLLVVPERRRHGRTPTPNSSARRSACPPDHACNKEADQLGRIS
ncbi:hypothetical protein [Streptomyces sp. BSE7-9]|uniref:hypothetical protein n=1 Tax=Streptomyces sp. BSE7-9 TaxID=2759948 RepID=UPI0018EE6E27|nr:hypothetical protein [Streptomyces sp. BSE7-9]MBJ6648145.1 hypothetical protein [Streptomyces sp. BSE7-9]